MPLAWDKAEGTEDALHRPETSGRHHPTWIYTKGFASMKLGDQQELSTTVCPIG